LRNFRDHPPEGIEEPDIRKGTVAYAKCLNQLGRCKQSTYYFRQALRIKSIDSQKRECMFYLAHNYYVIKRRRLFMRYAAKLLAVDMNKDYTACLTCYLLEKGQTEVLRVIEYATQPAAGGTVNIKKTGQIREAVARLAFLKKSNRFEGILLRANLNKLDIQPSKAKSEASVILKMLSN
jgi:tetratricopeptide (TPR) repeat protein